MPRGVGKEIIELLVRCEVKKSFFLALSSVLVMWEKKCSDKSVRMAV